MQRPEESKAVCAVLGRIATDKLFAERFQASPMSALAELGIALDEGEVRLAQRAVALLTSAGAGQAPVLDDLARAVDRMIQA